MRPISNQEYHTGFSGSAIRLPTGKWKELKENCGLNLNQAVFLERCS
jgi:hypothetical protein